MYVNDDTVENDDDDFGNNDDNSDLKRNRGK